MDLRRLGVVLLVFAVGLIAYFWYVSKQQARREQETKQGQQQTAEKKQPASAPETQPATREATEPPSEPSADEATTQQTAEAAKDEPAAETTATRPAARPEWAEPPVEPEVKPIIIGSLDEKDGYLLQVELTKRGAAIKNAKFRKYFATVADKQLYEKDPSKYEEARRNDPKKYKGHYKLLEAVGPGEKMHRAFETHRLRVSNLPGKTSSLHLDLAHAECHWELKELKSGEATQEAKFEWRLERDVNHGKPESKENYVPVLRVTKTYTVAKNDYSINVRIVVENLTKDSQLKVELDQFGPTGLGQEDRRSDYRRTAVGRLNRERQRAETDLKPSYERLKKDGKEVDRLGVGGSEDPQPTLWVGWTNKFFASLLYVQRPKDEKEKLRAAYYFARAGYPGQYVAGVEFTEREIAPKGGKVELELDVFVGPKKRSIFSGEQKLPSRPIYAELGYRNTIELRACFCAPARLTWGMLWLLEKLSTVSFGNYGLAIIFLVVLVRMALHPLTKKGQVSMMKMQKLAPQIQKIKEKYKDDKEALNREMMAVYRQAGARPLFGCLPMLLQMPIWIALFTGLNAAVELRHAGLLPVWITDLAAPDAIFSWEKGFSIPLLSMMMGPIFSFNLLPILLTVAMTLQMKMNPQTAQAAPDSPQAKQSKAMMFMWPVMMLLFFYSAPSGLNLYIMSSTFAGVAEQKIIRRHMKAREAVHAATETTVTAPGKAPRASRPKKPKGPLWFKQR
ncbi:MAG: YidC/Oxa1 family insertase periplasmic-domain containing protein [Planctomycetota bacterium]